MATRATYQLTVTKIEDPTPIVRRITLGGPTLADFVSNGFADQYVKLIFPIPGVEYPQPLDMEYVRKNLPRNEWPVLRTYTVRAVDPVAQSLELDIVVHGAEGLAGPWARNAQIGDEISLTGPGGAYSPDPAADWHLFVGDDSAVPAIMVAVAALPRDAQADIFLEVETAAEEQPLDVGPNMRVIWLHRDDHIPGELLVPAVRACPWRSPNVHVFAHGEAAFIKELRPYFRDERLVPRERLSISGYWRYGYTDEEHRTLKRQEREKETEASASLPA